MKQLFNVKFTSAPSSYLYCITLYMFSSCTEFSIVYNILGHCSIKVRIDFVYVRFSYFSFNCPRGKTSLSSTLSAIRFMNHRRKHIIHFSMYEYESKYKYTQISLTRAIYLYKC